MKRKKLVVVSHTEHYRNDSGQIVGWGATVNEINYLADYWDEVVHVGCFYTSNAPVSALPYTKDNIQFVAIPPYGGKRLLDKVMILVKIPKIIKVVYQNIQGASEVQLRLPTSMGLFLLPLFSFIFPIKYTFWVKYAGNWAQENAPLSYRMQRWWLQNKMANCKVTINGFWDQQPAHCLSFENPCLSEEQITRGKAIAENKLFERPFNFVFVGRLDEAKGISDCIAALLSLPGNSIGKVHFIGDGPLRENYRETAALLGDKVLFHGFLDSEKVHTILENCHFLLLPSKSEGFPKVIAEAACYGVIPVVSDVGSISHYVNKDNGFLWNRKTADSFATILQKAVLCEQQELQLKSKHLLALAAKFTFQGYLLKLNKTVFGNDNHQ